MNIGDLQMMVDIPSELRVYEACEKSNVLSAYKVVEGGGVRVDVPCLDEPPKLEERSTGGVDEAASAVIRVAAQKNDCPVPSILRLSPPRTQTNHQPIKGPPDQSLE